MDLIFDTHAHYDDSAFDGDREALIKELFDNGVCCVVNQGTDIKTSQYSISLAEKYNEIYAAVGLHPEYLKEDSINDIEMIRLLARHERVVAIGEIGLDYHYNVPRELQKEVFEKQLELAEETNLPVVIHDREAHSDILEYLKKYRPKGIVHCFSGSAEMAKEVLSLGMYIGIGGTVTFKNARKAVEVVEIMPMDRLVLETDAPYLSPVPFRGRRCDSTMIKYTAQRIAEIKNMSASEVLKTAKKNAEIVYGISCKPEN